MTKRILTHALILTSLFLAMACGSGASSFEDSLRQAEAAVASGDMSAAQSATEHLVGDENLSQLSATQLARLSMVYMQMADSIDQGDITDRATDLYDRAYKANADSADFYYQSIEPDRMQYVALLTTRSAARRHPIDMSNMPNEQAAMESGADSIQF